MTSNLYDISDLNQLSSVAIKLLSLSDNRIFAFYGEMGVGKTTFIKHCCSHLKVVDPISSPTFSIVNEYLTIDNNKVFHFDLYRLNNLEEVEQLGVEIYLNSGYYCFIEWPNLMEPFLPKKHHAIKMRNNNGKKELIVLE